MDKVKITERGYYDTKSEKCRLLMDGDILTVEKEQGKAPCKSKEGQGLWCDGVFVENGNFVFV
jgi:hypothetical protein